MTVQPIDLASVSPLELFGPDLTEARATFRRLARQYHPDTGASGEDMVRLNALWQEYTHSLNGSTIVTALHTYKVEPQIGADEIANICPCSWDDGTEYGYLRVARSPKNNDLIVNEVMVLKTLGDAEPAHFRVYVPTVVDTLRCGVDERQAVVTRRVEGICSLAEVHDVYPDGVDGRDAAWMWRRMLAGIGWAHQAGFIHGAILPENVFIHPEKHGIVFTNWSYAVCPSEMTGDVPLTAIVGARRDWYPQVVLHKQPVSPAVDIAMIAKNMTWLMGDRAPKQMRAFAKSNPGIYAWETQREFDALLNGMYGERHFRPFQMPG